MYEHRLETIVIYFIIFILLRLTLGGYVVVQSCTMTASLGSVHLVRTQEGGGEEVLGSVGVRFGERYPTLQYSCKRNYINEKWKKLWKIITIWRFIIDCNLCWSQNLPEDLNNMLNSSTKLQPELFSPELCKSGCQVITVCFSGFSSPSLGIRHQVCSPGHSGARYPWLWYTRWFTLHHGYSERINWL